MGHPIRGWAVYTTNPARLKEFYAQVFDWQIEEQELLHGPGPRPAQDSGKYCPIHSGVPGDINGSIAPDTLAMSYTVDGKPFTGVVVYVYTDDIEASFAKAVAAGATPRTPPTQIGDRGYVCQLLDPEGNPFMMWQPPEGWEPDDWARSLG